MLSQPPTQSQPDAVTDVGIGTVLNGGGLRALPGLIRRYAVGAAGPIASAGAQFALSLVLLRQLDAAAFGAFSFLLVASQLSLGIWGALFCAPLPAMTSRGFAPGTVMRRALFTACLGCAILAAGVFAAIALKLGVMPIGAALFAIFAAVSLLRWFARALSYLAERPMRTLASDLIYSAVLVIGVAAMVIAGDGDLDEALGLLCLAAVAGLVPFGARHAAEQFLHISPSALPAYRDVWTRHARWSLLGVVTTELTANAHAYLVTFVYGPASFAAVAASALLIRPVSVVQNALGEFERPRIARDLADGGLAAAGRSVRVFRAGLVAAWAATAAAIAVLFVTDPRVIFPSHYTLATLAWGAILWMAVALVRLARTPESILLQAAGEFRSLAWASVVSCVWSIAAVIALIAIAGPLWSIAGVLLGEAIFATWIWRQAGRWKSRFVAAPDGVAARQG